MTHLLARATGPAVEPVTLADAKAHLRVFNTTEDATITRMIKAAREHIEETTGRAIVTQTWKLWLDAFPRDGKITLPRPPLIGVTAIKYVDTDGAEQTLPADVYGEYPEGFVGTVARRHGKVWPATAVDPKAVEIEFQAGYGATPSNVPSDLVSALLLLVDHFYHNRSETGDGPITVNPIASERLLGKFKTHGWI